MRHERRRHAHLERLHERQHAVVDEPVTRQPRSVLGVLVPPDGHDHDPHLLSQDDLEQAGVAPGISSHPDYVRKRGVISRKREFDAALLGYTAQDAATMDPQFGVFHEVAWEALENAGYHSSKYDGLIGLYAFGFYMIRRMVNLEV